MNYQNTQNIVKNPIKSIFQVPPKWTKLYNSHFPFMLTQEIMQKFSAPLCTLYFDDAKVETHYDNYVVTMLCFWNSREKCICKNRSYWALIPKCSRHFKSMLLRRNAFITDLSRLTLSFSSDLSVKTNWLFYKFNHQMYCAWL